MWTILVEIDNGSAPNETLETFEYFDCIEDARRAASVYKSGYNGYTVSRVWVACEG